jgi:hypothetical protein
MVRGKMDDILVAYSKLPLPGMVLLKLLIAKGIVTQDEVDKKTLELSGLTREEFDTVLDKFEKYYTTTAVAVPIVTTTTTTTTETTVNANK